MMEPKMMSTFRATQWRRGMGNWHIGHDMEKYGVDTFGYDFYGETKSWFMSISHDQA